MKLRGTRKLRPTAGLGLSLAAVAALAAACGGGSGGSSSASSAPSGAASAPASSGSGSGSAGGNVSEVDTKSGDMGTYLTDNSGKTLYLFLADKGNKSACSGDCVTQWPPALTNGMPKAGSGVSGKLSTITRDDGSMQITYAGHPLYYFEGDKAAGDTNGQGIDGFGAKWWIVGTNGQQITKKAAATANDGGGSGSDAGGGWS